MAYDFIQDQQKFQVFGAYFSPVSDAYPLLLYPSLNPYVLRYGKPGLASWHHRVAMCDMAVQDNDSIMVDSWEGSQLNYVRTANVLYPPFISPLFLISVIISIVKLMEQREAVSCLTVTTPRNKVLYLISPGRKSTESQNHSVSGWRLDPVFCYPKLMGGERRTRFMI